MILLTGLFLFAFSSSLSAKTSILISFVKSSFVTDLFLDLILWHDILEAELLIGETLQGDKSPLCVNGVPYVL